mgnify:CR=1 FL=1
MNKHRLDNFLARELSAYQSTFKDTSFDSVNKVYVCTDVQVKQVYDFDAYIQAKFGKNAIMPASPDAIYVGAKRLYFVEFKNQIWSKVDKQQIAQKFRDGTSALKSLLADFTPRDCKFVFCVVHKKETSSRAYWRGVEAGAERFNFDALNKDLDEFYDDIIVRDVDFYRQNFNELSC